MFRFSADYLEIRRRYANLYVPSDFFSSHFRWVDAFPANAPFTLNKPCSFHIMYKDVDPVTENNAVLEPPDADYLFSAKVIFKLYFHSRKHFFVYKFFLHPIRRSMFILQLRISTKPKIFFGKIICYH